MKPRHLALLATLLPAIARAATPDLGTSILDDLRTTTDVVTSKSGDAIAFSTKSGGEGRLCSQQRYKTPILITAVAKTDSTNLRLYFGTRGMVIFNWEGNQTELRYHDPRTGRISAIANKGAVDKNTWVTIQWIINEKESRIAVDGVVRAVIAGDFTNFSGQVGIGTNAGAAVTVAKLNVKAENLPATSTLTNRSTPTSPASPNSPAPASFDFPVASQQPDPTFKPTPVTDANQIERPDYQNRPKSLQKSIASATALMVRMSPDGDAMGFTQDIIATVDPDSRRGSTAGIGIIRSDGDPTMGTALEEAVRAVKLRYPIWEPGHIDLSFGEKSRKHGGPSAGTAFALLMLSVLEGFELDPKCAVTGDITVDWKVRKVGGVTAKIRGATLDKCLYAAIPENNEASFADMALLYGTRAIYDIQVFSIATLQDANAIARKDRPENLQQAMRLFTALQSELSTSEKPTLQKPETRTTLKKILELAPNHLSAKYLLAIAEGKASKTLSANATMYKLDIIMYPYMELIESDKKIDRSSLAANVTITARKQLAQLRPIAHKDFLPLLIDETALIESLDQFAANPNRSSLETLKTRASAFDARKDELFTNKDLRATLRTEGY